MYDLERMHRGECSAMSTKWKEMDRTLMYMNDTSTDYVFPAISTGC